MAQPASTNPDFWPQRSFFIGLVDAKVEEIASRHVNQGVSRSDAESQAFMEIAQALGLESSSGLERSYRYDKTRRPKRQVLEKATKYFGVELWQIYGPKPEPSEKDELALAKEALQGAMGSEVLSKLTDEQILAAYRVAMTTARAMLSQ